jgi:nitroimidazol reductase NimA-like FMN-containing flavoprotein (pyridoxamine 5'-phosphate oxidase superfamily)
LSRADALGLLAGESIGRVGVTVGALPAILPVNYGMLDGMIVFRTAPGTKLSAAVQEAVVAFEVDHADSHARAGWSVLVVGHARRITDAELLERVRALELRPWAPGQRDHFVQISPEMVTGRRINPPAGEGHSD